MRRLAPEAAEQLASGLRVRGRDRPYPRKRLVERTAHAQKSPVAKYARKTIVRGREGEPVRKQPLLVHLKKRRAGEHREVHRTDVMAKARQCQFARLDRAARLALLFDDRDLPPLLRE